LFTYLISRMMTTPNSASTMRLTAYGMVYPIAGVGLFVASWSAPSAAVVERAPAQAPRLMTGWNLKMLLVRQSTARQKTPEVLDPHEIQNLLLHLEPPYHLMVLLAATTGLRRSELFALQCRDIDFTDRMINVTRSIYGHVIGNCKTEASQKAVPLAHHVAAELSSLDEAKFLPTAR
jgi:integrase